MQHHGSGPVRRRSDWREGRRGKRRGGVHLHRRGRHPDQHLRRRLRPQLSRLLRHDQAKGTQQDTTEREKMGGRKRLTVEIKGACLFRGVGWGRALTIRDRTSPECPRIRWQIRTYVEALGNPKESTYRCPTQSVDEFFAWHLRCSLACFN